jgi:antitoxin component YwqK of YwqJK toxin-antitoxin module
MKSSRESPLNGPHKELFADGGLSGEGRLNDGKRHGKWTFYYKSGGLKAKGKYVRGELDGRWDGGVRTGNLCR